MNTSGLRAVSNRSSQNGRGHPENIEKFPNPVILLRHPDLVQRYSYRVHYLRIMDLKLQTTEPDSSI